VRAGDLPRKACIIQVNVIDICHNEVGRIVGRIGQLSEARRGDYALQVDRAIRNVWDGKGMDDLDATTSRRCHSPSFQHSLTGGNELNDGFARAHPLKQRQDFNTYNAKAGNPCGQAMGSTGIETRHDCRERPELCYKVNRLSIVSAGWMVYMCGFDSLLPVKMSRNCDCASLNCFS